MTLVDLVHEAYTNTYDREILSGAIRHRFLKDFTLVTEPEDVPAIMQALENHKEIAIDTETTGLDFNRDSLHGISLATDTQEWYVCQNAGKAILPHLKDYFSSPGRVAIGHNIGFDFHFLYRYGVKPVNFFDTMVGQWYLDENESLGLKHLASVELGFDGDLPNFKQQLMLAKGILKKKRVDMVNIYDIPLETLAAYAGLDGRLTYDLKQITESGLREEGLLENFNTYAMPFLALLVDMENNGFWIDQKGIATIEKDFREKMDNSLLQWSEITGGVNPRSHDQLREYLFKTMKYKASRFTDSGAASTDQLTLERLLPQDKNGAIKALLDYKRYEKLISTYIIPFSTILYNGRLYGSFNQTGAKTGRLSSSSPNLQNIPARGEDGSQIRSLFAAPKGKVMVVIDYSQIELRLLAHFCEDPTMLKTFREGLDPHQITADLLGIERRDAKTINFGIPYGIGPSGLQNSLEEAGAPRPTMDQAKAWLDGYMIQYPNFPKWKNRVHNFCRKNGYVETITKRRRHLPDINSNDYALRGYAERQGPNAIIQGSAADIIQIAMLKCAEELHGPYEAKMLAQVHDELVWEVPEKHAEEFAEKASKIMEGVGREFNLKVDLIAEPGIGPNWSAAK